MRKGEEIQDYNLRLIIGLHFSKAGVKYKKVYIIMNLSHVRISNKILEYIYFILNSDDRNNTDIKTSSDISM